MSRPLVVAGALAGVYVLWKRLNRKVLGAPLPPGPKGLPIIGNALDWPSGEKEGPCEELSKMADIYGDIMYFNTLGASFVVLSSYRHVTEILNKKGRIYSNRPEMMMAGTLVGWENDAVLLQYGKNLIQMRRLFSGWMGTPAKVAEFEELIRNKSLELTTRIRSEKFNKYELWKRYFNEFSAAVIANLVYGKDPSQPENSKIAADAREGTRQFAEMIAPNAFLVDIFPSLRHVPSWFPGASWKTKVPFYRQTLRDIVHGPYNLLKAEIASGTSLQDSFLARELSTTTERSSNDEHVLKWACSSLSANGIDTVVVCIEFFIMAICLQPSAQAATQEELDRVLGKGAEPALADRPNLPYTEAFYKECFRLYGGPVLSLGVPHLATEDDIHDGYLIPKDSVVFANVLRLCHDSSLYADPEVFRPERFLGDNPEMDPKSLFFGWGRRACPGEHLAYATLWLCWTTLLSQLSIRSPSVDGDESGLRVTNGKYATNEAFGRPIAFDFIATPRA